MGENGIGARLTRTEDQRFLRGKGNYVDDINRPGQNYAVFVRSPHAHANIKSIDTSAAQSAPGVIGVFVGEDLVEEGVGPLICGWAITSKDGTPMNMPGHMPLSVGKVTYVGDPVAMVVAETVQQARDAAEQVSVDWEELPAVIDVATADAAGTTQIHENAPNNVCYDWHLADTKADVDAAFDGAAQVTSLDIVNNRLIPNAMEPRSAIGECNTATGDLTFYTTSQNPHVARLVLSAFSAIAPEHKLRVVAPDVGGGFGSKIYVYSEDVAVIWAARKLGATVKWTADRAESFLSDAHGRDHVTKAELALDADGKFLAMRVSTTANLGGYMSLFSSAVPTYLYATLLAGQYTTPLIYCEVKTVFTNTTPVDAYRGAGRPEATYVVERLVEAAAREMNIDPAELRKRNIIQPDQFPYETPVVHTYDIGDYGAGMDRAMELADYAGFSARREQSKANGKLRGIGFSAFIEACGIAPSAAVGALGGGVGGWESAEIRFNPTGNVTVFTGSHSHGQSHQTTFAQVVSDQLGVPVENIDVVHGDTDKGPFGMGTYGSRSIAVGGSAIIRAGEKIIEKGKKIAAHILEAAEDDIEFADGNFTVAGTDKAMNIGEVAFAAFVPHNYPEGLEPGLGETAFYDPLNFSFPSGTHICEVEIDPETGVVDIANYVAVDDFGTLINPLIVEGQVHGGLAQGIGQALTECASYDASGQLITGSYMDYCMPRADDVPSFVVDTTSTPSPLNPLGVKGCGEAGAIASPAAVMNAITDALGTENIDMPATPQKVWRAAQAAG
jgi:carbon-monoxide dehydrogenase large subunit